MTARTLADLLVARRAELEAFVRRNARSLLAFESADDLVQGIHACALDRGAGFVYRSEKEALGFLFSVARGHLCDRRDYWSALKRRPRRLLRLTAHGGTAGSESAAAEPAATATGPATHASRREELALAVRALAVLLPRDRELVTWYSEGVEPDAAAERLGISRDAAARAQLRALERFRKAYAVLSRG